VNLRILAIICYKIYKRTKLAHVAPVGILVFPLQEYSMNEKLVETFRNLLGLMFEAYGKFLPSQLLDLEFDEEELRWLSVYNRIFDQIKKMVDTIGNEGRIALVKAFVSTPVPDSLF